MCVKKVVYWGESKSRRQFTVRTSFRACSIQGNSAAEPVRASSLSKMISVPQSVLSCSQQIRICRPSSVVNGIRLPSGKWVTSRRFQSLAEVRRKHPGGECQWRNGVSASRLTGDRLSTAPVVLAAVPETTTPPGGAGSRSR